MFQDGVKKTILPASRAQSDWPQPNPGHEQPALTPRSRLPTVRLPQAQSQCWPMPCHSVPTASGRESMTQRWHWFPSLPFWQFQVLFNSLFKVLCIFPSWYLCTFDVTPIFSFRWNWQPRFELQSQATGPFPTFIPCSCIPSTLSSFIQLYIIPHNWAIIEHFECFLVQIHRAWALLFTFECKCIGPECFWAQRDCINSNCLHFQCWQQKPTDIRSALWSFKVSKGEVGTSWVSWRKKKCLTIISRHDWRLVWLQKDKYLVNFIIRPFAGN